MLTHSVLRRIHAVSVFLLLALVSGLASAAPRTIDTAYGPVTVTGQPQRIVTLHEGALDAAVAAGVQPVGAIITRGGTTVASYIQSRVNGIRIVGAPGETNIEAVLALQPDLILAAPRTSEEQYRILSMIAPTIVPDVPMFQPDSWIRETRLYGEAMGRQQETEEAIAGVLARIDELRTELQGITHSQGADTSLVRWMPQGPMLMSTGIFSATLLRAVGFDVQDGGAVREGRPHSHALSHENLGLLDRTWIFLATLNSDGDEALASASRSPAFGRLHSVQEGRVIHVDGQLWSSATGPVAALAILDELQREFSEPSLQASH